MHIAVLTFKSDLKKQTKPLSLGSSSIFLVSGGILFDALAPTGQGTLVTSSGNGSELWPARLCPVLGHAHCFLSGTEQEHLCLH